MRAVSSRAARTDSRTSSNRVSSRAADRMKVESVRCRPRALTSPASFRRARARSSRTSARPSSASRARKSQSTLWWKPGSASSRPSAYLKSMRQRTASAACRSERLCRNCRMLTVASWAGDSPGRPSRGYHEVKSSSRHSPSSRSRTHIAVVPRGLLARATCAVRAGTCRPERGDRDTGSPRARRTAFTSKPIIPVNHHDPPANPKIPDRVDHWGPGSAGCGVGAEAPRPLPDHRAAQPAGSRTRRLGTPCWGDDAGRGCTQAGESAR